MTQQSVLKVELDEGETPPFPFLIAGFIVDEPVGREILLAAFERRIATMPPGVSEYRHQYDGHACKQASLVGYGVDVPDDPAVRAGIQRIISTWGKVGGHTITGGLGTSEVLRTMLPGGSGVGHEALLRSAKGAPISCLRGRPIVRPIPEAPGDRKVEILSSEQVTLEGSYSDEHERVLQEVGAEVGATPIVALLWGNSD